MTARSLVPILAVLAALAPACTSHSDEHVVAAAVAVDVSPPAAAAPRDAATIEIFAAWPDRSASEIEREIVVPIERALTDVVDVKSIHGSAWSGRAALVLTLEASADVQRSKLAVRERLVAASANLPSDVTPVIGSDLAPPASARLFVMSTTTGTSIELHRVASALRDALYEVPGVGAIELCGGRESQVVIALDPARLTAHGLSVGAIVQTMKANLAEDIGLPSIAGVAISTVEDLLALVVARGAAPLALRDVASISVEPKMPGCDAARIGGGPVVIGSVRARRGADLDAVDAAIRARLAAHRLPEGFALEMPAAAPRRLGLDLTVTAAPEETLVHASRAIGAALAAAGPDFAGRLAYVQARTASRSDVRVGGELLLESIGRGAEELLVLDRALASLPGVAVRGSGVVNAAGELDDPSMVLLRISGDDLDVDRRLAREAAEIAETLPGVLHAAARDGQELTLALDLKRARLAMLGLAPDDLLITIVAALDGAPVGSLRPDGSRMPVVVHIGASQDQPAQLAGLPALEIGLPGGGKVRLDELVEVRRALEPGTITRLDRRRAVTVEVRLDNSPAARVDLRRALDASLQLPPGYVLIWDDPRS